MDVGVEITSLDELRQGDVIDIGWLPRITDDGKVHHCAIEHGAVIVSQTCDIVNESPNKTHVTMAPIIGEADASKISLARKGQTPLVLYLQECEAASEAIAELQHVASVPRSLLIGKKLLARHTESESGSDARELAQRIGRAYSRFAFPDPVVKFLDKFRKKARKASKSTGSFGEVLDFVHFRIKADKWNHSNRRLTLYIIVLHSLLIVEEDADPLWEINPKHVIGLKGNESPENANLNRLSDLLVSTSKAYLTPHPQTDGTTLLHLWRAWTRALRSELLEPFLNEEITDIEVELVSEQEFTYFEMLRSVTLDLEDLSTPIPIEPRDARTDESIRGK